MGTEDLVSAWRSSVSRTASFVARDFPGIEKEDLTQHLFLKILENSKYLKSPDEIGATKLLLYWARTYAKAERAEHLTLSVQYSYRTSDVKNILDVVFSQADWENVKIPEDAMSEFNDVFLEVNSDVKRAWESLGHKQKVAIFVRYALGEIPQSGSAESKFLSRSIVALTDKLNWYQKPSGGQCIGNRRVITNAQARYQLKNQIEE